MMEDRIQRAVELFRQGYNCSQSVCAAFADEYGYTSNRHYGCRLRSVEGSVG